MSKIAIVQSCYIPWKGYFDLIQRSDLFVLYDCAQYTKRDWRNRNRIKTLQGLHWLTIPVEHHTQKSRICDITVSDGMWQKKHWETIRHHYAGTRYFLDYKQAIEQLFLTCHAQSLSDINLHFLQGIMNILGITTPLVLLKEPSGHDNPTDNLLSICKLYDADHYLSGPSAQAYLEVEKFSKEAVSVEWINYNHYLPYIQQHPPFEHGVSIIDMLFNTGAEWKGYL